MPAERGGKVHGEFTMHLTCLSRKFLAKLCFCDISLKSRDAVPKPCIFVYASRNRSAAALQQTSHLGCYFSACTTLVAFARALRDMHSTGGAKFPMDCS